MTVIVSGEYVLRLYSPQEEEKEDFVSDTKNALAQCGAINPPSIYMSIIVIRAEEKPFEIPLDGVLCERSGNHSHNDPRS